ncbi:hypothetical protein HNO51_16985 [Billgrantia sulfidoxydans]|uniref:Glycosyl transferase family 51 domain-containing protein n=1 Tax=Billgrantia sulfidoxydans TaxID=2733484 RepID=A0ABX7W8J8_9GAMM|nr:transglycosylase domain-containing protein [Halomonas sulfidoxydans]QTP56231.1 hypothetical protein HNO51_16985 [Halomonas sulfidoxydans]
MNQKEIFDIIGGKPAFTLDIKGWLIYYNLILDKILLHLDSAKYSSSLAFHDNLTEFEKYVVLLEDKRYFNHRGVDLYFIPRALKQLVTRKRIGGISTIEQQYIRTILNRKERTLSRKHREIILSWLLAHRACKKEVLKSYLGSAYFGYKINSCDEASLVLFRKNANEAKAEEAALLASLLVYPLPKQVIHEIKEKNIQTPININNFFQVSSLVAPNWSSKISRRLRFAISLSQAK